MNRNNNTYNEKEVKNKLKNFKEGADYSVSPTEEPEIKTYSFFNDELKSWFRNDRVPVKVTREAYDGKDYTYRGHFEEGKDYYYSRQHWNYGEDYQGKRGTDVFGNGEWKNFMDEIKWDEHYRENTPNKLTMGWVYRGKGRLNRNNEPKQVEPNFADGFFLPSLPNRNYLEDFKRQCKDYEEKLRFLEAQPISYFEERGWSKEGEICDLKEKIKTLQSKIEHEENYHSAGNDCCESRGEEESFDNNKHAGCHNCGFKEIRPSDSYCIKCGAELCEKAKPEKSDKSDLEKENRELKKQLAEVKNQLKEVLEELKKLRNNSAGKNNAELEQQIDYNEKLICHGEEVPEAEIKEQVQKSQALLEKANFSAAPTKDNSGSGSLPYIIGGAVLVSVAATVGYYLWNRKRKSKIS